MLWAPKNKLSTKGEVGEIQGRTFGHYLWQSPSSKEFQKSTFKLVLAKDDNESFFNNNTYEPCSFQWCEGT